LTKTLHITNIWEEENPARFNLVGTEQEVKQGEVEAKDSSAEDSSKVLANDNITIVA
jgi:hypothetical protein